ncbi:MAG: hypothetical protein GY820_29595 [Gammaproteobacteria bacterium]|nr:hypothetical protein [Gammaproteobacteria bacterium]
MRALKHLYVVILFFLAFSHGVVASPQVKEPVYSTLTNLDLGMAVYLEQLQNPLASITQLEAGNFQQQDNRLLEINQLELAEQYFEYGLSDLAEQLLVKLISQTQEDSVRDLGRFSLVRIYFKDGVSEKAAQQITHIRAPLSLAEQNQLDYIKILLMLERKQFSDSFLLLDKMNRDSIWRAYALYNLAVAQAPLNLEKSKELLLELTGIPLDDEEARHLVDRAFFALGLISLQRDQYEAAIEHFLKLHEASPFASMALHGLGKAWAENGNLDRALGYWNHLGSLDNVDLPTLEALLAIPKAWEQKKQQQDDKILALAHEWKHKKILTIASQHYQEALNAYNALLKEYSQLSGLVSSQKILQPLFDSNHPDQFSRVILGLNSVSQNTERTFLSMLFSDEEIRAAILQYRDMNRIHQRLVHWRDTVPQLRQLVDDRLNWLVTRMPDKTIADTEKQLNQLVQQRDSLSAVIANLEKSSNYSLLTTKEEVRRLNQIDQILKHFSDLEEVVRNDLFYSTCNLSDFECFAFDGIETSENTFNYADHGMIEVHHEVSRAKDKYRFLSGLVNYQIAEKYQSRLQNVKLDFQSLNDLIFQTKSLVLKLQALSARKKEQLVAFAQQLDMSKDKATLHIQDVESLKVRLMDSINKLAVKQISQQQEWLRALKFNALHSLARLRREVALPDKP